MKHPLVQYFCRAARSGEGRDLGLINMLSTSAKLGPANEVRTLSRSLAGSCCARRANGSQIASKVCCNRCYGWKITEGRPTVTRRVHRNDQIASRPDFVRLMVGAIRCAEVLWMRIHDIGDFDSVAYVLAWIQIAKMLPDVRFWAYTRAWRAPELVPAIAELAALPNMDLILSFDRDTGWPHVLPELARAWLADTDRDTPPRRCPVVFRGTNQRNPDEERRRAEARQRGESVEYHRNIVPLRTLGASTVCPLEQGRPVRPEWNSCIKCQLCMRKARKSKRK